jgi:hypothetical protein
MVSTRGGTRATDRPPGACLGVPTRPAAAAAGAPKECFRNRGGPTSIGMARHRDAPFVCGGEGYHPITPPAASHARSIPREHSLLNREDFLRGSMRVSLVTSEREIATELDVTSFYTYLPLAPLLHRFALATT